MQRQSSKISNSYIVVSNKFVDCWSVLEYSRGDRDRFPKSLEDIDYKCDPNLFVVCNSWKKWDDMRNISEWSDFIYVGNVTDGVPDAAVLISPPENHGDDYGMVLLMSGRVLKLDRHSIERLIYEPWRLDTISDPAVLEYLKERLIVHVPAKFSRYKADMYKGPSQPNH